MKDRALRQAILSATKIGGDPLWKGCRPARVHLRSARGSDRGVVLRESSPRIARKFLGGGRLVGVRRFWFLSPDRGTSGASHPSRTRRSRTPYRRSPSVLACQSQRREGHMILALDVLAITLIIALPVAFILNLRGVE